MDAKTTRLTTLTYEEIVTAIIEHVAWRDPKRQGVVSMRVKLRAVATKPPTFTATVEET